MRDDPPLWWTIGTWRANGQIRMCKADNIFDACVLLQQPPERVHQCSTPYLLEAFATMPADAVYEKSVESLPSVYDQFTRPGFRGWDYQAMRDAGFEVD